MELSKSETRLDEQFAVLTRMTYSKVNELIHAINRNVLIGVSEEVAPIDYDQTNKMFVEWQQFKNRPDWRDHSRVWFMGGDLSMLPPPPEPQEQPEAKVKEQIESAPEEEYPEGATMFGGNYAEGTERDETTEEEGPKDGPTGEENEVPGVPQADQASG